MPRHREDMVNLKKLTTLLVGLLLAGTVAAQTGDALLQRLQPQGYTNDFAGILRAQDKQALDQLLARLEQQTGAQVAVVTLESLEGGEIRDFTNRLFEKWGIGQAGTDNGVLFLMAQEERRIQVEVGYGLEGLLPDARVGRILDDHVIPSFRRGDFSSGLVAGVSHVAQLIAEDNGADLGILTTRRSDRDGPSPFHVIIGILMLILFVPLAIRHPWLIFLLLNNRGGRGGFRGGGFGGGGFGGFGGGMSGGGGAGRGW